MKVTCHPVLVSIALLLANTTYGQAPFGLRGGGGFSWFNRGLDPNFPIPTASDDLRGSLLHAGIFVGAPVKHLVSMRGEFTMKMRRQHYSFDRAGRSGSTTAAMFIMQIPALVEVRSKHGLRGIFGTGLEFPLAGFSEAEVTVGSTGGTDILHTAHNGKYRGMMVSIILDAGYAFQNGVCLAVRADLGQSSIWQSKTGLVGTRTNELSLCVEYDVNARPRQRKKLGVVPTNQ